MAVVSEKDDECPPLLSEETIPSPSSGRFGKTKKRITKVSNDAKIRPKGRKKRKSKLQADVIIKNLSLFCLVAQMVGLVLLMRYSRTTNNDEQLYLSSTAVFLMEVMKFCTCLGVVFSQNDYSLVKLSSELYFNIWASPWEILKLSVPSILYTVQNNLLYFALSNLDAATYQVCYQLKILTTAVFSAVILNRHFSLLKWMSLVILTVGVAVVQSSGSGDKLNINSDSQNHMLGFIAVLCATCTSGFSGVYFEKILKGSSTSLWIRNIQMGLTAILVALILVIVNDGQTVRAKGFFVGYSLVVWIVVIIQAIGGLIVAVVVKYADNVLKGFATSFSIIISCIISSVLFDFKPNLSFCIGTCLVVLASVMYSRPERRKKIYSSLPLTTNQRNTTVVV